MVATSGEIYSTSGQCPSLASHPPSLDAEQAIRLTSGEILIQADTVTEWGALVRANLHVPQPLERVWNRLGDYSAWTKLLPSLSESQQLDDPDGSLLYQAAGFQFLGFAPKVETYLRMRSRSPYCMTFRQVRGTLARFAAELQAAPLGGGTLVTYDVSARLPRPLPALLLRQGIQVVLPFNLRHLQRSLCG